MPRHDRGGALLKVVNARGYGVATEHTPGLDVVRRDRGGLLDITAELLTPRETGDDNTVVLQGGGDQIHFGVSTTEPRMGVMVQPDPGAYLLSALDFAVATYTMVMERVGVSGATDKLLTVLKGSSASAPSPTWPPPTWRPPSRRRSS